MQHLSEIRVSAAGPGAGPPARRPAARSKSVAVAGAPELPLDIWIEIAQHVPANPFTYLRLSQICRNAHIAFTRDDLWRKITPSCFQKNGALSANFARRYGEMCSEEAQHLYNLWTRNFPEGHKLRIRYFLRDLASCFAHNGDLVLAMCAIDGSTLEFVPGWHSDYQIVAVTLVSCGYALCFVAEHLRDDRELVVRAVQNTSVALCHASMRLRNDKDVVRLAVKAHGFAFCYASPELKRDREFCLEVVRHTGRALEFVELKSDRKLVLAAVRNYGPAIQYAATHFRADKEIVLRAVRNHGTVLALVAEKFRDDLDVVLTAIRSEAWALEHASPQLRNNKQLVIEAVGRRGWCLRYASERLRNDREIVQLAVRSFPGAVEYASPQLRGDFQIIMSGMCNDPSIISLASPKIRTVVFVVIALAVQYVVFPVMFGVAGRLEAWGYAIPRVRCLSPQ